MIDNTEDIIDSRDVHERISEMEMEATSRWEEATEFPEGEGPSYGELAAVDHAKWLDEEDADEYRALKALEAEGENAAADWFHGATLIREDYFEDYARQLAEDIGAIDPDANWPLGCIDWEKAANELLIDYTSVEFDGVTYWVR